MLKSTSAVALSVALIVAGTSAAAQAQEVSNTEQSTENAGSDSLGEIIVTANKREQSLQSVPLAISAIDGAALQSRGIRDISSMQSYVPNLRIGQERDDFKISLRGIGIQGTSSITDSGVAFYADNFYLSRPAGGNAAFFDIQRVEVLRGPQGTLYGRNAAGGVVNVISNEPTDSFGGEVGVAYGERNLIEARGVLNVPLATDVSARVSAMYTQEDGYVKNLSGRALYGSTGDITVRGQLKFGRPESIEVLLYGLYSDLNGTGSTRQFLERRPGGVGPARALLATAPADSTNPLVTNADAPAFSDSTSKLIFARVKKELGPVDIFLQGGAFWQKTAMLEDLDGSPVNVATFARDQDNRSQSVELRFSSNNTSGITWIVGGYYFNEDTDILRRATLRGLLPTSAITTFPDFLLSESGKSSSLAAFGSVTVPVSDRLRFTGGLRYTHDKKSGSLTYFGNFGSPLPPSLPNALFPARVSYKRTNWNATVEFDAADDVLLYGRVSTGYKAGGFNLTSDGRPYDPESITAYELGIKSDLFGGVGRVNIDGFYYDYKDQQFTTLGVAADGVTPGQFTSNSASSTIAGLEVDTQWKVSPRLTFSASYTYMDATFAEYLNRDPRLGPGARVSLEGNRLPFVSDHTINLGLRYRAETASGRFEASINTSFHSDFFLREFNDPVIDRVPANTKTDLNVSYTLNQPELKFTIFATNLENNIERSNIFLLPGFLGISATTSYTKPRTVGARVELKF